MSNNKFKVLVVEDEANICSFIYTLLETNGYQTFVAPSCELGQSMFGSCNPDLIILDLGLPDRDGVELIRYVRQKYLTPIIVLSARTTEADKIEALDLGANDYITKPFGIMEFLSRVRAALRRSAPEEKTNVYAFHEILLDNARHSVTVNGAHVDLTYKEYSLLRLLLENTNLVVTRETILQVVWGTDISVESRTVDMHIRTLRKKLGDAGKYICTVRKVGYKLADSEEESEE